VPIVGERFARLRRLNRHLRTHKGGPDSRGPLISE
jgi:hypothetical protein